MRLIFREAPQWSESVLPSAVFGRIKFDNNSKRRLKLLIRVIKTTWWKCSSISQHLWRTLRLSTKLTLWGPKAVVLEPGLFVSATSEEHWKVFRRAAGLRLVLFQLVESPLGSDEWNRKFDRHLTSWIWLNIRACIITNLINFFV